MRADRAEQLIAAPDFDFSFRSLSRSFLQASLWKKKVSYGAMMLLKFLLNKMQSDSLLSASSRLAILARRPLERRRIPGRQRAIADEAVLRCGHCFVFLLRCQAVTIALYKS